MFEFGFKNKIESHKVKLNKNIFPIFDRAKKTEEKKEDKKVQFKFTGDGEAQRFVNSDPIEQLGKGIEESLGAPKQADSEIMTHSEREKSLLKKMIASSYENIFNIEIPEENLDLKKEFEEAVGKGGKFSRIRASFATTMRNKVGFSNDEVEERMKKYYLKKMNELDLSEELKRTLSGAWETLEDKEDESSAQDVVEKNENSIFEIKIKEIEDFLEHLKERINSSTEEELQPCSFYRNELAKFNKDGLDDDGIQKLDAAIAEYQKQINEIWKVKKEKLEYEGRLNYRIEMVKRALNGWKNEIEKMNPEEGGKLMELEFYINNVSKPKEDGLKGEYLERLRLEAGKAEKEITHVWQEKKHEIEVEKNKKEFESAIKKIREISKEEYEKIYEAKDAGEHWLDYDLRNEIRGYLDVYLDHVVHPIDASPSPEVWNDKWKQMQALVEKINSETDYELVIVDGETYSVQVLDQDVSHMTESYDEGFTSGQKMDAEDQFSNIAGSFEGYAGDNESVKDLKSEEMEKHEDESMLEVEKNNLKNENENENENWENISTKLPTQVIDVFRRYCLALHASDEVENLTEVEISDYLRKNLLLKIEENKEFLFKEYNFDEKDAIIFVEKIIKKYKNKLGYGRQL